MTQPKPNPWTRPLLVAVPLLVAPLGVAQAANTNADVRTLDIEIVDSGKGAAETTKMTVALDGDRTSRLSLPIGDFTYDVKAHCDSALPASSTGRVPTTIALHRFDHRPGAPGRIDVDAAAGLAPGNRTVIATIQRPDGSRVEVAIRIH
jgi:hypothetical protein